MIVKVDGWEYDTDSVEIVTNEGTTLLIEDDLIAIVEEGFASSDGHMIKMTELINLNEE